MYSHKTWIADLNGCHRGRRKKQFAIGDAINRAQLAWDKSWGRKSDLWKEASASCGVPANSLFQYARVARVFPEKDRNPDLSFSTYHVLASVADDATRNGLLERAVKEELSCERLRELIREPKTENTTPTKVSVRIAVDIYSKLRRKAKRQHTNIAGLLRSLVEV